MKSLQRIVPFWPLLVFYALVIAVTATEQYRADEPRYLLFADRLLDGEYAGDPTDPDLTNGPGLPILLMPAAALDLSVQAIRYMNVFFMWGAVVFLFKAMRLVTTEQRSRLFAWFFALFPLIWAKQIYVVHTEIPGLFWLAGFAYYFLQMERVGRFFWRHVVPGAVCLGMLILTKIQYTYIAIALVAIMAIVALLRRRRHSWHGPVLVALGLAFCLPYFAYAYSVTGRVLYLATNGGSQLYWMTVPYEQQSGSWIWARYVKAGRFPFPAEQVEFITHADSLGSIESNEVYKQEALRFLREQPRAYLENLPANASRLLFNFPISYTPQGLDEYFYLVFNGPFVLLVLLSVIPAARNWRRLPWPLVVLLLTNLMYLGGTLILSAASRYFIMLIPIFVLWLAYVEGHLLRVHARLVAPGHPPGQLP